MTTHKILYHASHTRGLTMLKPANQTPRFAGEPNYIFATPYKALAAMFLAPRELDTEISEYGERFVIFINSTLDEYKKYDKGGSIYKVDGNDFETDASIGMGETEWVCGHNIEILTEENYDSSILAMKLFNVETYFVNDDAFTNIRNDPSNGLSFVSDSSRYID